MRRIVIAAIAIAIVTVACFPQGECESPFVEYCFAGDPNCQGHIIDATHWESGPIDGAWLPYGPEQVVEMHMRDAVTGQLLSGDIVGVFGLVGATQSQDAGILPAPCAGQLCEVLYGQDGLDPSTFDIKNDTCSSEFLHVVVTIVPSAASDAGAE